MAIGYLSKITTRLFDVKPSEYERFILMLMHAFLSGLGIALTYTLISILIVESKSVEKLPLLYLLTAVLLLTKGYFYAHLEHSNQPQKLFKWVLLSLFLWSFLMFLNLRVQESFLIIALAYCSYYAVYYLSNLEYWGTASLLFDVRQGKRLFGLLSSGESVAKILGYAMTPLIIAKLDKEFVYLVVAICFFGAYMIFHRLVSRHRRAMVVHHHSHDAKHGDKSGTVLTILSIREIFTIDNFRKYISLFAFLSTVSYFIFQYAFLLRVEKQFKELAEIAVFFAALLSIAKILNLLIKVFLSSRLCRYLGLNVVMLILPISLLLASAIGIAGIASGQSEESFIMWVFATIMVLDEMFRTSLYTPAYLTLFQPLSKVERLEGHTLTKGIMEPLGLAVAGVMIYILVSCNLFKLQVLTPIVIVLLVVWILVGNRVFQEYLEILKNALKSKILKRGTLQLSKDEYEILRNEKLGSDDPVEKLYALQMLGSLLRKEEKMIAIQSLLDNKDPFIVKSVLKIAEELEVPEIGKLIIDLMHHPENEVKKLAIYEYGREHALDCVDFFSSKFDQFDDLSRSYMIGAAIKHGGLNGAIVFGTELMEFINSDDHHKRIHAANIISDIGNQDYYHPLIKLLNDKDLRVREAAIQAAGEIKNYSLIPHILKNKKHKRLRFVIRKSLSHFDEKIRDVADRLLQSSGIQERIEYIRLFDKNFEPAMSRLVFSYIADPNFEVRAEAINSLFNSAYMPDDSEADLIHETLKNISQTIKKLLNYVYSSNDKYQRELIFNEIYQIQLKLMLKCMSLNYSRKIFRDVIENCYSSMRTNKTLALELLDNTLSQSDKRMIVPLVESVFDIGKNLWSELEISSNTISELVEEVLMNNNSDYSSWITANFMRISDEYNIRIDESNELHKNDIHTIKQESKRLRKRTA